MRYRKSIAILFGAVFIALNAMAVSATEYLFKLRDDTVLLFSEDSDYMSEECFADESSLATELGVYTTDDISVIEKYAELGLLDFFEENGEAELFEMPKTSDFLSIAPGVSTVTVPLGQSYAQIGVDHLWSLGLSGKGVTVAVIDSGVNAHPDIVDNLLPGYNYSLTDEEIAADPGAVYTTYDKHRHGTMVAGLIAANGNHYRGIAYEAKIVPIKCFRDSDGKADIDDLAQAMIDAVDIYNCDIINMSCGVNIDYTSLRIAASYVASKGVPIIAAAGNSGSASSVTDACCYPASIDSVVSVANIQKDDTLKSSSQKNDMVDVAAPGTYIYGLEANNSSGYCYNSGTSFACPITSGVAALMLQADPTINDVEMQSILQQTAFDLGDAGKDVKFGYGKVNCAAIASRIFYNKLYRSPIIEYKGTYNVAIRNGFDAIYESMLIFSNHTGIRMIDISVKDVSLGIGESAILSIGKSGEITKLFELDKKTLFPLRSLLTK